jgi:hypothetical protein
MFTGYPLFRVTFRTRGDVASSFGRARGMSGQVATGRDRE